MIDNPLDLGTITDGAWHNVLVYGMPRTSR